MTEHQNNRAAIENLQRYLRQIALSDGGFPPPPIDGIFESATEEALRSYQSMTGAPQTGSADQATWERLYADYRASLAKNAAPRPVLIFPFAPIGFGFETDSRGFEVGAIQFMLRELGRNYAELEGLPVTGEYDKKTTDAVKIFQERSRLEPHGRTDLLTWNTLADQYNTLFSKFELE